MYVQQNLDTKLHPNFKLLIRELNSYGRTVERIHILPDKWVFYVNPPYNGNNTIEIDYILNSDKELDRAIKKIRSIPEFEKIMDENLDTKSKILNEFRQRYVGHKKDRFRFLRKFHYDETIIQEDFPEFYGKLLDLALSNFVSPEELRQIIRMYEKKKLDEVIILPNVGKYGWVNLEDVKVTKKESYQLSRLPIQKLSESSQGPILVRRGLISDESMEEERENIISKKEEESLFQDENFVNIIKSDAFTIYLIEKLKEELISSGECDPEKDYVENLE